MDDSVQRFNAEALRLQASEFWSPANWDQVRQQMRERDQPKDYTKLLDPVAPLLTSFRQGEIENLDDLTTQARVILRNYGHGMSVLAVRRNEPRLIRDGLTAVALLGFLDDWRDLIYYLATLHHSAIKLKLDAAALFTEASELAIAGFQKQIRDFPWQRPSLASFNLREIETEQGFAYYHDSSPAFNPERAVDLIEKALKNRR